MAAVLIVALFLGALWLTESQTAGSGLTPREISQSLGGATKAEVSIEPSVAILNIKALPESASLVQGTVHLGSGETVAEDYSQTGSNAVYSLKSSAVTVFPFGAGWNNKRTWDLGLSPGATLQLQTSMGVGLTLLDLTGLALSDLKVSGGVGEIVVTLPANGRYRARLDQGIGQIVVIVPDGLALRVKPSTALAGRQLPSGLQDEGQGVWTSPGYATATNAVDLEAGVAIGNLIIRYGQ